MRSSRTIHTVSCHAEGEVGDVIVGGVKPPPGETLWAQSRFIAEDQGLRRFVLNEPRGGVFRHVNLLVPPKSLNADAAFIIMEPEDTPPMSGSNSICVSTVLLETGIAPMTEPETRMTLEAPGGLIHVVAACRDGRVERVTVTNVASFACALDVPLEVEGLGTLTVDTAFGGDSFVIVDASDVGLQIAPDQAADIARTGVRITAAATEQLGFAHPNNPDWRHISFCNLTTQVSEGERGPEVRSAVAIRPGKIDRSPCGTGVSARMAVLAARGEMGIGDTLLCRSIIGSEFTGRIAATASVGNTPAIVPEISGRAWITGTHQHMLDPDDPWPGGYRLSDTWGAK